MSVIAFFTPSVVSLMVSDTLAAISSLLVVAVDIMGKNCCFVFCF